MQARRVQSCRYKQIPSQIPIRRKSLSTSYLNTRTHFSPGRKQAVGFEDADQEQFENVDENIECKGSQSFNSVNSVPDIVDKELKESYDHSLENIKVDVQVHS